MSFKTSQLRGHNIVFMRFPRDGGCDVTLSNGKSVRFSQSELREDGAVFAIAAAWMFCTAASRARRDANLKRLQRLAA